MACSMILIALFAKILPRKTVMTLALILASALAILISVSESFGVILALRFAQGMLLAGFPSMAVAYINEEFDAKIIGAVTGIYVAGTSVGGLVGRMSLSFLTDGVDGFGRDLPVNRFGIRVHSAATETSRRTTNRRIR